MKELQKIIIKIDKEKTYLQGTILYETQKGIFPAQQLDDNTKNIAKELFQILFKHIIAIDPKYKIYCYNYNKEELQLFHNTTVLDDCCLAGADYNSIDKVIQKINFVVSLKQHLIPLYVEINNKTFFLNSRIIQIKKGIKNPKELDIETYAMMLKELKPNLFKHLITNKNQE